MTQGRERQSFEGELGKVPSFREVPEGGERILRETLTILELLQTLSAETGDFVEALEPASFDVDTTGFSRLSGTLSDSANALRNRLIELGQKQHVDEIKERVLASRLQGSEEQQS